MGTTITIKLKGQSIIYFSSSSTILWSLAFYSIKIFSFTNFPFSFMLPLATFTGEIADTKVVLHKEKKKKKTKINETGSRSPCMRPRSDPPNFGPITKRIGW